MRHTIIGVAGPGLIEATEFLTADQAVKYTLQIVIACASLLKLYAPEIKEWLANRKKPK